MSNNKLKTILLVEDEAIIAAMEKNFLEKYGYAVITADTGEKAIEIVESTPAIDLVLMDINLGAGIDGTEAAVKILEKHEFPLVFLSAHTDPKVVEKTEKITSYGYIVKNSGETVLIASVKMAFRLFEAKVKEKENTLALSESEEKYRTIFNNSVEGIFQTTPEGRYRTVNPSFARMFRYDSPDEMINAVTDIGQQLYVHPEDRKRLIKLMDESQGMVKAFEAQLIRKDGSKFWVSINACIIHDKKGTPPFIEGTCMDITERKRTEEALRESEIKYRTLIENSTDVIFSTDKDGYYNYVNKVFASTFNKTQEYFNGKSLWDIYSKEQADLRYKAISQIFQTGEPGSVEVDVPLPDKTLHFLATLNPIKDSSGNVVSVLTHSRNITNRKQMEEALKESEANFKEIFENSLDNIFVIDVLPGYKFKIKIINNNLAKLIRKNPKEFENKFIDEIFPENISGPLHEKYRHCVDSGRNYCYDEVIELFDQKIYYSTNLVPIFNEDNKIFRIIGISRNITEHKLAEEKINNLLHEKELILKEVHHRIKNNMNTIFGLLTIQANAPENISAKNILDDAAGRVRSMMVLYDKLYCSKDNSTISLKEYLPALVNEIAEIFSKNIPLKIQMQVDDIILGTRILSPLGIIINELVSNAVKYAFTDCNDRVITVNASKKENHVLITFKDNGSGLPESISFKNSSGFGLQLIEMLIKQINGSITIERQNGTCFTIKFEA